MSSDGGGEEKGQGVGDGERELRAVFVLGTIVAGREAGFALPGVSLISSSLSLIDGFFSPFLSIGLLLLLLRFGVGRGGGTGKGWMGGWVGEWERTFC